MVTLKTLSMQRFELPELRVQQLSQLEGHETLAARSHRNALSIPAKYSLTARFFHMDGIHNKIDQTESFSFLLASPQSAMSFFVLWILDFPEMVGYP